MILGTSSTIFQKSPEKLPRQDFLLRDLQTQSMYLKNWFTGQFLPNLASSQGNSQNLWHTFLFLVHPSPNTLFYLLRWPWGYHHNLWEYHWNLHFYHPSVKIKLFEKQHRFFDPLIINPNLVKKFAKQFERYSRISIVR
jgi:hypothetical protein